jgi:hypothetical protein
MVRYRGGGRSVARPGIMQVGPAAARMAYQAGQYVRKAYNGYKTLQKIDQMVRELQMQRKRIRTTTNRTRTSRPRVNTLGQYRGRFRRPRKYKTSSFSRNAVKFTLEHGGTTSNNNCGYIGHGVAVDKINELMANTILKFLFEKGGFSVNNFQKKINGDQSTAHTHPVYRIEWKHRIGEGEQILTSFAAIGADETWATAAATLVNQLYASVTSSDEEFHLLSFTLYSLQDPLLPLEKTMVSTAMVNELYVNLHFSSTLNIQNQTLGTSASDDQVTDVTNNPLEGKIYSGWGNGLTLSAYNISTGPVDADNGFVVDHQKGVSKFSASGTNITAEMQAVLNRPPSPAAFNEKVRMASIRLPSGGIKKSYISYKKIFKLQTLFNIMLTDLRDNPQFRRINIGKYELVAVQKLCRTGTEQPISLGYEVNQTYSMSMWRRKIPMTPTHQIL